MTASRPAVTLIQVAGKKGKILLVDDHDDSLALYAEFLGIAGHEVKAARSVTEAIELCRHDRFDLLVSDIRLRDGSGLDLIRHIQEDCHLPGIALSGLTSPEDVEAALAAGFSRHLTKPIDLDTFVTAVEELLGRTNKG